MSCFKIDLVIILENKKERVTYYRVNSKMVHYEPYL